MKQTPLEKKIWCYPHTKAASNFFSLKKTKKHAFLPTLLPSFLLTQPHTANAQGASTQQHIQHTSQHAGLSHKVHFVLTCSL